MTPDEEVITPAEWANESAVSKETRIRRNTILRLLSDANKATVAEILEGIRAGTRSIVGTSRAFMDLIRKTYKPTVVSLYRSMLPPFFESVLGEGKFSRTSFDRKVAKGKGESPLNVTTTKKSPKVEDLRNMLLLKVQRLLQVLENAYVTGLVTVNGNSGSGWSAMEYLRNS